MSLAPALDWQLLPFNTLTTRQLHDLLQLRSAVFVVEQTCVFQDVDGADPQALHLLGSRAGQLLAYARCFAAGIKYPEVSIGRVVTDPAHRGTGLGHALIRRALQAVAEQWGGSACAHWRAGTAGGLLCQSRLCRREPPVCRRRH